MGGLSLSASTFPRKGRTGVGPVQRGHERKKNRRKGMKKGGMSARKNACQSKKITGEEVNLRRKAKRGVWESQVRGTPSEETPRKKKNRAC